MAKYHVGESAYLLESRRFIREGKIGRITGNCCLFCFIEGGGIQVPMHRLYATEEAAQAELDRIRKPVRSARERLAFFL